MSIVGIASNVPFSILNSIHRAPSSGGNFQQIQSEFQRLGQDLKSGNLTAAQQDYETVQQDLQKQSSARVHHHHHHYGGGQMASELRQEFNLLGQALQAGNLQAAQSAFAALQQELPLFTTSGATPSSGAPSSPPPSTTGTLNVTA
jgi:hypothetical protein